MVTILPSQNFRGCFVVVSFGSSGCLGNGWRIMMSAAAAAACDLVRACVQLVPASCTYMYVVQCNLR